MPRHDPGAVIVAYGDHLPPLGILGKGVREGGYRLGEALISAYTTLLHDGLRPAVD